MKPVIDHPWQLDIDAAWALQRELAAKVRCVEPGPIATVAGVDVAYAKDEMVLVASVVLLDAMTLEVVEAAEAEAAVQFPYVPGLFSFRELPAIMAALEKLSRRPDLVVCDGQGLAHPRRFGLACHLGVLYDLPTLGCAKTRLVGEAAEPASARGSASELVDGEAVVGRVLRTQDGVKPVDVSIGHRITLDAACDWILRLTPRYRLPETTRQADQRVRRRLAALG
ncbi:deoxyribonuclease V [Chitinimonas lacunae]|uniref:Endonuclease V n=1 Tax=Chitinimonas lacunae TaxID=1963018 RepID=A0ABV8MRJ2_9NEIS